MSKKSKKVVATAKAPVTAGKLAAYSVYATGACATVTVGSTLVLENAKLSRKEKKKVRKIRDTSAMATVVGAMGTMVYTTYATMADSNRVNLMNYAAMYAEDDEE